MSSDCEYVFKIAHNADDLDVLLWYGQPISEGEAILTIRVFDAAGKQLGHDGSLLSSEDVPHPYLPIPAQSEPGLHRVGTISAQQRASTIKVAALAGPTLQAIDTETFPKSFIAIERPFASSEPGEQAKTNIIPGRPSGSSK